MTIVMGTGTAVATPDTYQDVLYVSLKSSATRPGITCDPSIHFTVRGMLSL